MLGRMIKAKEGLVLLIVNEQKRTSKDLIFKSLLVWTMRFFAD